MTEHITVSRELLRQVLVVLAEADSRNALDIWDVSDKLRNALEQPAVEPVAEVRAHMLAGYEDVIPRLVWLPDEHGSHPVVPVGTKLFTAPQAQQPARIGSGVTVEQTLEQWEHDFRNPMTPEQQADWVKRERDFAARQAQQPEGAQR